MTVRSSKDIKRELLRRAFSQGRGAEMILLLQWRSAQLKHETERGLEDLHRFEDENFAQPRAVRMLNILAALEGEDVRFGDTEIDQLLDSMPRTLN